MVAQAPVGSRLVLAYVAPSNSSCLKEKSIDYPRSSDRGIASGHIKTTAIALIREIGKENVEAGIRMGKWKVSMK